MPLVLELVFKVNRSSEEMLMRPFKILYVKIKSPRNRLAYREWRYRIFSLFTSYVATYYKITRH